MCTYESAPAGAEHPLDNRGAVPDHGRYFADWKQRSAEIRARSHMTRGIRYGSSSRTELDWLAAARRDRPTIALIHGGYWQWNTREEFAFAAEGVLALELNVAVIGYTLAPQAQLAQIVAEIGVALDWLISHRESLSAGDDLYLMGWSAGAHLAAMQLGRKPLAGLIGISGVYDLAPVRDTPLDSVLHLSDDDVTKLSPMRRPHDAGVVVQLACGGDELPELQRQTVAYADALRGARQAVTLQVVPGRHHYDVLEDFAQPDGPLLASAARAYGW